MTQSLNPNFAAENAKDAVKRVFIIEINGEDTIYTNANILNVPVGKTVKQYLQALPNIGGERIDLLDNKNTINDGSVMINDINAELTGIVNSYLKKEIVIKNGFDNIDYADFERIFAGKILNLSYDPRDLSYKFEIGDKQKKLQNPIFTNKAIYMKQNGDLVDDYNLTLTNITYSSSLFNSTIKSINFVGEAEFIYYADLEANAIIGEDLQQNLIKFTSGTNSGKYFFIDSVNQNENTIRILESEMSQAQLLDISIGDSFEIVNIDSLKINGHMIDFLLFILDHELNLISQTKATTESLDDYDYIDSTFTDIRDDQLQDYDFQYYIEDSEQNAYDFLTNEILKLTQTYIIPNNDGYLNLSIIKQPTYETNLKKFDDDINGLGNIIDTPTIEFQTDKIINQIIIDYDYDEVNDNYDKTIYYLDGESIENYSEMPALRISSKILNSNFSALQIIELITNRIFSRYRNPEPIIKFSTTIKELDTELNDLIDFSSPNLPDIVNGNRFIKNSIMQVVNKNIDYSLNVIDWEVFDTQYQGIATVWTEDVDLLYENATADQQNFWAFWSDEDGNVEDSEGNLIPANGWSDI